MAEFKPLNLAHLYSSADAAVGQAMQMNLMAFQASRMKAEYDEEDALRSLAKTHFADGQGDLRSFAKAAMGVAPLKAPAYAKMATEAEKSELEKQNLQGQIDDRRVKMAKDRLDLMNNASAVPYLKWKELVDGGMPDAEARKQVQPMHENAVMNLVNSGIFTREQMSSMKILRTPQFDPTVAETGMRQVMGAKDGFEAWLKEKGLAAPKSDLGKLKADFDAGRIDKATFEGAIKKQLGSDDWTYDAERAIVVNKKTGESKPITGEGGTAVPPKSGDVEGMRKEFNNREEVKAYNTAAPILRAISKSPDTAAGDLDLIYGVGKILDPNSVVREGEMHLVIKSGTPIQRILGVTRWSAEQGGRLAPEQRSQLVEAMQGRVTELYQSALDARKPFEAQAKAKNIPLDQTLTLPELPQIGSRKKAEVKAPAVGHVEDGWKFKGGDPSKPENWEKAS